MRRRGEIIGNGHRVEAKQVYAFPASSLVYLFSLSLSLSPEEDPVIRQFGEEVNEEDLFAELQAASGIDQIITENEKLIAEK